MQNQALKLLLEDDEWQYAKLFGKKPRKKNEKKKNVSSTTPEYNRVEVFSIVGTLDIFKNLWVKEATQLIYSGIAAHFSFQECEPRIRIIKESPENLSGLRHLVIANNLTSNFELMEAEKAA